MVLDVARSADIIGGHRSAVKFMEDVVIGFAHHRREDVEAPAMRHADDDLFDAERAAALDDLFERGNRRFCAVEAEAFCPVYLVWRKFSKPSASVSFLRIAILPSGVNEISLSLPSMRCWIQDFLLGIRHVHELDGERPAISPLQDRENFAQRRRLKAKNAVDVDRPIRCRPRKSVCRWVEFRVTGFLRLLQRVEVGDRDARESDKRGSASVALIGVRRLLTDARHVARRAFALRFLQ